MTHGRLSEAWHGHRQGGRVWTRLASLFRGSDHPPIGETMTTSVRARPSLVAAEAVSVPGWVEETLWGSAPVPGRDLGDGLTLGLRGVGDWWLVSASIRDAATDRPAVFQRRVQRAYESILTQLTATSNGRGGRPVRCWNFIPGIHRRDGDGLDRYMVFNAGRYAGFEAHDGRDPRGSGLLPTASGVGHNGEDLVIECLATTGQSTAVENPRQYPAYRYSSRYGPLPPCFSRAMIVPAAGHGPARILIGGTASVRGEDSLHRHDLSGQLQETFVNIASVIRRARCFIDGRGAEDTPVEQAPDTAAWLGQLVEARVYYPNPRDRDAIVGAVTARLGSVQRIELCQAQLCRPELLVEIEAVARCSRIEQDPGS